jgi:hypothetical protein
VSKNGDVEERFLHFTDLHRDWIAKALFQHAKQVLCDFNLVSKLLAQTCDGAAVMADEHVALQADLDAVLVNCHTHILNLVLSQSLRFIKPVKIFFTSLSGFGTFKKHSFL